ncbi:DUF4325 domain-containing protein [Candidatus Saccharibacteria bacterium]|nr:DUF4325 domain-containing protein [Candidatus Saccharibacteria bacterium]
MFNMNASEFIYGLLKKSDTPLSAVQISKMNNAPSRTYTAHLLSGLVSEGKIIKNRVGKEIFYSVKTSILDKTLKLKNLHEDEIWEQIRKAPGFIESLSDQAETALHFAFTEMLNNAIDHSESGTVSVLLDTTKNTVFFTIRDFGIGAFNSLMSKKSYPDTLYAIQELIKGKNTSDPVHHSGEGIFWTSKIADRFEIRSYDYSLIVDNIISDYTIKSLDQPLLGTEVYFEIEKNSQKSIRNLFHEYSLDHNSLSLDTTSIPIKLYNLGEAWISRSQAKKVLDGLDKFRKIIFDFKDIDLIGQGFADEIFRVWQNSHPDIILETVNANKNVEFMINHAKNTIVE